NTNRLIAETKAQYVRAPEYQLEWQQLQQRRRGSEGVVRAPSYSSSSIASSAPPPPPLPPPRRQGQPQSPVSPRPLALPTLLPTLLPETSTQASPRERYQPSSPRVASSIATTAATVTSATI